MTRVEVEQRGGLGGFLLDEARLGGDREFPESVRNPNGKIMPVFVDRPDDGIVDGQRGISGPGRRASCQEDRCEKGNE